MCFVCTTLLTRLLSSFLSFSLSLQVLFTRKFQACRDYIDYDCNIPGHTLSLSFSPRALSNLFLIANFKIILTTIKRERGQRRRIKRRGPYGTRREQEEA